jgi:hypothetical protein
MKLHKSIIPTLTLFGSVGTLLCCALPALFVSLGAGAALIGLVSALPQLVWLSAHKIGLFIFAGTMLAVSCISRYASRHAPCPVDPEERKACLCLRKLGFGVYCFSLGAYVIGFFFAFVAPHLIK